MVKKSKITSILLVLFCSLLIVGCSSNDVELEQKEIQDVTETTISEPVIITEQEPNQKWQSTVDLILRQEEFPDNFEIVASGPQDVEHASKLELKHGWEKGYYAEYKKTNSFGNNVEQDISIIPKENIDKFFVEQVSRIPESYLDEEANSEWTLRLIDEKGIGDGSIGIKITIQYYNTNIEQTLYEIMFYKGNVYETITGYDYTLLVELARKAEQKI